jgi:hypothetical protein
MLAWKAVTSIYHDDNNDLVGAEVKKKIAILLVLISTGLFAEENKTLGIMDIAAKSGIDEADSAAATDLLYTKIFKLVGDRYQIIARNQREELLKEQKFSVSGLSGDVSYAIEVGKLLAANYIVFGSMSKIVTTYHMTLMMVNTETSAVVGASTAKSISVESLIGEMNNALMELFGIPSQERTLPLLSEVTKKEDGPIIISYDVEDWYVTHPLLPTQLVDDIEDYIESLPNIRVIEEVEQDGIIYALLQNSETDTFSGMRKDTVHLVTISNLHGIHPELGSIHLSISSITKNGNPTYQFSIEISPAVFRIPRQNKQWSEHPELEIKLSQGFIQFYETESDRLGNVFKGLSSYDWNMDQETMSILSEVDFDAAIRFHSDYHVYISSNWIDRPYPITLVIPKEFFRVLRSIMN